MTQEENCTSDLNWMCFQWKEAVELRNCKEKAKSQESVGFLGNCMYLTA
jgi:hypothetical protein